MVGRRKRGRPKGSKNKTTAELLRERRVEKLAIAEKKRMSAKNLKDSKTKGYTPQLVEYNTRSGKLAKPAWRRKMAEERPEEKEAARQKAIQDRKEARGRKKLRKLVEEEEQREVNEAKRELAKRILAKKHLLASILRFNPHYLAGWVHKDICARLEKFMREVEDRRSPRLMLQMPPRHGKSTIASQEFPAWVLGHHPEWEIIACSYAESLALDFSRAVRERLRDEEYLVLWKDTRIDPENQNAQGWKTSKKGGFLPAGVGGPITGKGAHILVVDDPVKNAQEAESETTRESIDRWYSSTAYTRLAPGGGVLVIQTRWHLDDLSGRLEHKMLEGTGDTFEIVRYPAIATEDERFRKRGEALHPDRYSKSQLMMIQKAVGPRTWSALYQQNPVPDEGAAFQQSMIQYYRSNEIPEELTYVAAWDLAIGQHEANDRTVGFTWGRDIVGQFWFVDCRRGLWDAAQIVDEICDAYEKWKPKMVGIEKDKIAQAVGPFLDTEIDSRGLYGLYVEELSPAREGTKLQRCRSLQGLMRRGKVFLPHPDEAPWVSEFVSELLQFPYGRRDDHVDAAAWLALMATDTASPGPTHMRVPRRKSWRDRLATLGKDRKSMMSS